MANRTLKTYRVNRSIIKGKLFELVLNELISKAGFLAEINTDQLTRNKKRLHGRGATYDPDIMGQFAMGIPFVNPIMIIGEAKNYNHQVTLANVREFLGAYIDFSQYERVDTKSYGDKRYSVLYKTRFTYCPIYFSIKGFQKSAEGFMFAHGINHISYKDSDIITKLFERIEDLLDKLTFYRFEKDDFRLFNNLETISNIQQVLRKRGFDNSYNNLISYLARVNSLIGVLDRKYPIHILYEKSISASLFRRVELEPKKEGVYILKNNAGRKFGEFSLSTSFINEYVRYAKKQEIADAIFKQIDVVINYKGTWEIRQLLIEEASRNRLLGNIEVPNNQQGEHNDQTN